MKSENDPAKRRKSSDREIRQDGRRAKNRNKSTRTGRGVKTKKSQFQIDRFTRACYEECVIYECSGVNKSAERFTALEIRRGVPRSGTRRTNCTSRSTIGSSASDLSPFGSGELPENSAESWLAFVCAPDPQRPVHVNGVRVRSSSAAVSKAAPIIYSINLKPEPIIRICCSLTECAQRPNTECAPGMNGAIEFQFRRSNVYRQTFSIES